MTISTRMSENGESEEHTGVGRRQPQGDAVGFTFPAATAPVRALMAAAPPLAGMPACVVTQLTSHKQSERERGRQPCSRNSTPPRAARVAPCRAQLRRTEGDMAPRKARDKAFLFGRVHRGARKVGMAWSAPGPSSVRLRPSVHGLANYFHARCSFPFGYEKGNLWLGRSC